MLVSSTFFCTAPRRPRSEAICLMLVVRIFWAWTVLPLTREEVPPLAISARWPSRLSPSLAVLTPPMPTLIWLWRLTMEPSWNLAPPPAMLKVVLPVPAVPKAGSSVIVASSAPLRAVAVRPSTSATVPLTLTVASWPKSLLDETGKVPATASTLTYCLLP